MILDASAWLEVVAGRRATLPAAVGPLLAGAWPISEAISASDALYVALAIRERVPLLTADARLARGVADLCDVRLL